MSEMTPERFAELWAYAEGRSDYIIEALTAVVEEHARAERIRHAQSAFCGHELKLSDDGDYKIRVCMDWTDADWLKASWEYWLGREL